MPTQKEVVDAIMEDEEVPQFIRDETERMRALFQTARHRRGKQRVKAMNDLEEEMEKKLLSAYTSYKGIIGGLKIKNMRYQNSIDKLFHENERLKERIVKKALGFRDATIRTANIMPKGNLGGIDQEKLQEDLKSNTSTQEAMEDVQLATKELFELLDELDVTEGRSLNK